MKWILVYIILVNGEPISTNAMGTNHYFNDMMECFLARDNLSFTVGGDNGFFPPNTQAVCIPTDK
jgi:hypothetical protein|tara:strand:+ start:4704 stop:4898 length:195 start_codon:yes stop_codon:yes gene_type:complete